MTVLVFENQFHNRYIERHALKTCQIGFAFLEFERFHSFQGASCILKQLDLPVVLQRRDEFLVQIQFHQPHVLRTAVPNIKQHRSERHFVLHGKTQNLLENLVFGLHLLSEGFALQIHFVIKFLDHHEIQRHSSSWCDVSHIDDVHAFDRPALRVIEIVGDHARFFAVGFLNDDIVDAEAGVFILDFSDDRFDEFPVVFAGQFTICEGSGDAVMAEFTIENARETGGGGLTEVGDQVVAVNVDHLAVHAGSLGVRVNAVKPSRVWWVSDGILKLAA
jgi:hypothetical protein